MTLRKRGLGRGLDALLGTADPTPRDAPDGSGLQEIPVDIVQPGKYQPRREMDSESLSDLADSIRAQGVMQPIVVRAIEGGRFEIIAGERRWRASQLAGKGTIPAIIRDVNDETAVAMSLIENIQREDLNPMEEAYALKRLQDEFHLTHQQMADAVGKNRATVTNFLRLVSLDKRVASLVEQGKLEMGHARALLTMPGEQQASVADEVVRRGLNVRQTEALVRKTVAGRKEGPAAKPADADTRQLEDQLSGHLGQPVSINHTRAGKGKVVIRYSSLDELDGVLSRLLAAGGKSREI